MSSRCCSHAKCCSASQQNIQDIGVSPVAPDSSNLDVKAHQCAPNPAVPMPTAAHDRGLPTSSSTAAVARVLVASQPTATPGCSHSPVASSSLNPKPAAIGSSPCPHRQRQIPSPGAWLGLLTTAFIDFRSVAPYYVRCASSANPPPPWPT